MSGAGNPLILAAGMLLPLMGRLARGARPVDPEALHRGALAEIRAWESRALDLGADAAQVKLARYVLCATLDDVVLNASWNRADLRGGQGLVAAFHREGLEPGRFYDLLAALHQDPAANPDLLELMAVCLSLGFIGPLRDAPGGMARHEGVCAALATTLAALRPPEALPQMVSVAAVRPARPYAAMLVLAALLLAGGGLVLTRDLALRSDAVLAGLWPAPVPVQPATLPDPPLPLPFEAALRSALATDLAQGSLRLQRDGYNLTLQFDRRRLQQDSGFVARLTRVLAGAPGLLHLAAEGAPQLTADRGYIGAEVSRDQRARAAQSQLAAQPGLGGRVQIRHDEPAGGASEDTLRLTLNAGAPL